MEKSRKSLKSLDSSRSSGEYKDVVDDLLQGRKEYSRGRETAAMTHRASRRNGVDLVIWLFSNTKGRREESLKKSILYGGRVYRENMGKVDARKLLQDHTLTITKALPEWQTCHDRRGNRRQRRD